MIQLTTVSESHIVKNTDNQFYSSVIACLRALTDDATLTVTVGETDGAESCDLNLPLIADTDNQSLVALIRGLSDSFAMMRLYHDPVVHDSLAPQDLVADRLFTLLERDRFESLACRRYVGVARNLARAWEMGHSEDAMARFGGAEQLEFVLSCLAREKLSTQPLPQSVSTHLSSIRGPIENLVGDKLNALPLFLDQQYEFGLCVLDIVKRLGFDIKPRAQVAEESSDTRSTGQIDTTDEAAEEMETDDDSGIEQALADNADQSTVNEETTADESSAIVRNAEHEQATEAEPDDTDVQNIVEIDLPDSKASTAVQDCSYRVFTQAEDEECAATQLADLAELRRLREHLDSHIRELEPQIGQLASRLQQVLLARQESYWTHDLDEGELDPRRLTRFITSPLSAQSYREKAEALVRDTAVTLLIDNSRSMSGYPIVTAAACADLITRILERCNVSVEVLGFTTVSMYGGSVAEQWNAAGSPQDAGRLNSVRHIVYKSAEQSWRRSRTNFGLMLQKDILKQNIDGEALLWATRRLRRRVETRRILIVLSDGRPSDSSTLKANPRHFLTRHLKQVVTGIERQRNIELVALGIGHDVGDYYERSVKVDDVNQLGRVMLIELTQLLMR